mmetsp:Transcript_135330/g.432675  ORF Transcript_135330/g.432675 Transcript_135330/m.432675 type:complete len:332 (+) Transcript_135330:948-1943(+)
MERPSWRRNTSAMTIAFLAVEPAPTPFTKPSLSDEARRVKRPSSLTRGRKTPMLPDLAADRRRRRKSSGLTSATKRSDRGEKGDATGEESSVGKTEGECPENTGCAKGVTEPVAVDGRGGGEGDREADGDAAATLVLGVVASEREDDERTSERAGDAGGEADAPVVGSLAAGDGGEGQRVGEARKTEGAVVDTKSVSAITHRSQGEHEAASAGTQAWPEAVAVARPAGSQVRPLREAPAVWAAACETTRPSSSAKTFVSKHRGKRCSHARPNSKWPPGNSPPNLSKIWRRSGSPSWQTTGTLLHPSALSTHRAGPASCEDQGLFKGCLEVL